MLRKKQKPNDNQQFTNQDLQKSWKFIWLISLIINKKQLLMELNLSGKT